MSTLDKAEEAIVEAASRVLDLEAELEAAGNATTGGQDLDRLRKVLHIWVDSVVGVVSSPGVGRVSLIHQDGRETRIASSDLPYLLSKPVKFGI